MSLPNYDSWKLASPPAHPREREIEEAENAASRLARLHPEIDDDCPGDVDDAGQVYVDLIVKLRVPVDSPQRVAQCVSDALLDLADRVGTPHEQKKRRSAGS